MKAMILAAGKGTRLLPLTKNLPKCLMPLAGRPLIDWQLSWLKKHGVTECAINLHHLPEQVRAHCGDGAAFGLHVEYSFEPELLGTAGAVKKVSDFFVDAPFLVIYGDNFSQWNLQGLKTAHENNGGIATIAVHWREDVSQSGVVKMNNEGRITGFVEKPSSDVVPGHLVNAGFYYLNPDIFYYIPEGEFCDFAHHVFPTIMKSGGKVYAVKMDAPIIGIDTKEAYRRANDLAMILSKGGGGS